MFVAGVDLEPDLAQEPLVNVTLRNCSSVGNAGAGFQMYLRAWPNSTATPFSVLLEDFTVMGGSALGPSFVDGSGIAVGGVRAGVAGTLGIRNCSISGTARSAVQVRARALSCLL